MSENNLTDNEVEKEFGTEKFEQTANRLERVAEYEHSIEVGLKVLCWIAFFLMLIISTALYFNVVHFDMSTSIYFAIQTMFAIGFGTPVLVTDGGKIITIFVLLAGTCLNAAVTGMICSVMTRAEKDFAAEESELKRTYYEKIGKNVEREKGLYKSISERAMVTARRMSLMDNRSKSVIQLDSVETRIAVFHYGLYFIFVILIAVGIIYARAIEKTYLDGVFFAISTMTTAGIATPRCNGPDPNHCDILLKESVFFWFYILIGCSVYTIMMSVITSKVISLEQKAHETRVMYEPLTKTEFEEAAKLINEDGDGIYKIDFAEFVVFEMLRLHYVDHSDLAHYWEIFHSLDTDDSNEIEADELFRLQNVRKGLKAYHHDEPATTFKGKIIKGFHWIGLFFNRAMIGVLILLQLWRDDEVEAELSSDQTIAMKKRKNRDNVPESVGEQDDNPIVSSLAGGSDIPKGGFYVLEGITINNV